MTQQTLPTSNEGREISKALSKPVTPSKSCLRSTPSSFTVNLNSTQSQLAKHVHFATCLESTRYFNLHDMTVSILSEPVKQTVACPTFRTLRTVNFCSPDICERRNTVQLKRLYVSATGTEIRGIINVANLAFEKVVAVRFTTDQWQTVSEVLAKFHSSGTHMPGYDEFRFTVDIGFPEARTLFLCVRYRVGYEEFWDNNENMDYHIDIPPLVQEKVQSRPRAVLGSGFTPFSSSAHTSGATMESIESIPQRAIKTMNGEVAKRNSLVRKHLPRRYCWEQSFAASGRLNSPPVSVETALPCKDSLFNGKSNDDSRNIPILGH